jgi:tetratricopeptide (TPR) repeat protein
MTPAPQHEKEEAFSLFEDGRYQESLQLCSRITAKEKDAALDVLTATNLFYLGKSGDAEVSFRDLARKMPDSSYVHSYLGKVLEARNDEGAIAEYATAVHLDPKNLDALRSYAGYLVTHGDYYAALPVLRSLVRLSKKADDIRILMRAFIEIGEAEEALALHAESPVETGTTPEYIDALVQTGNYPQAAESSCRVYRETHDPAVLRKYLDALSHYDLPASLNAYAAHVQKGPDRGILSDYILLLKTGREYGRALEVTRILLSGSRDPVHRLLECELLTALGQNTQALAAYEQLISDELGTKNDLDTLGLIIREYRQYLMKQLPAGTALQRFLTVVSQDVNVASLTETARFYEDIGDETEARAWYYRAYRADFLAGGLVYAQFLAAAKDERECEKVMLYILSNIRKSADLTRVASIVVDERGGMFRMKRLMDQLVTRLEERRATLSSEGLELLAVAFFITASNALEEADYAVCKYFCLCGMDVMPAHTGAIQLEDYLRLIRTCKVQSVADRPVMHAQRSRKKVAAAEPVQEVAGKLGLSEQEQQIVLFLRSHRTATEMDLRTLLGTRRVTGLVNRLVKKASAQGVDLIEKKGIGNDGEVYEYTGT